MTVSRSGRPRNRRAMDDFETKRIRMPLLRYTTCRGGRSHAPVKDTSTTSSQPKFDSMTHELRCTKTKMQISVSHELVRIPRLSSNSLRPGRSIESLQRATRQGINIDEHPMLIRRHGGQFLPERTFKIFGKLDRVRSVLNTIKQQTYRPVA